MYSYSSFLYRSAPDRSHFLAPSLSLNPPPCGLLLCHRVTPWLWAKWGRVVGGCSRMGSLQRRGSALPKARQVQRLPIQLNKCCSYINTLANVWTSLANLLV